MEYRTLLYIILAVMIVYIALKQFSQLAINKIIKAEIESVLNKKEHKVKGRFG